MTRDDILALPPGGDRLKAFLKDGRVTLDAFADRIGVANAGSVWKYIANRRHPKPRIMAAIVRETGGVIQPNDFLVS